jgi:hypothetical protein
MNIADYIAISPDSPTGLVWIKKAPRYPAPGTPAFTAVSGGYYVGRFGGPCIKAHRVVYYLTHGKWPDGDVDHIDGDKMNNSPDNLRDVPHQTNTHNRRLTKGYSWHSRQKTWNAKIVVSGKQIHLGSYSTEEDARQAYLAAKRVMHQQVPHDY